MVLFIWLSLLFNAVAFILALAWLSTGMKNKRIARLAGISIFLGVLFSFVLT